MEVKTFRNTLTQLSMEDRLGNSVKPGDVLLQLYRGSGDSTGKGYTHWMQLWEMPEHYDGHGYNYNMDGSKYSFAWVDLKYSIKVDLATMPEGFEYSFKHGMGSIRSKIEEGSVVELIENSNWKQNEILQEDVEKHLYLSSLEINTIEDIYKNAEFIQSCKTIPNRLLNKVLKVYNHERATIHNGEIGLAMIQDSLAFSSIIHSCLNKS